MQSYVSISFISRSLLAYRLFLVLEGFRMLDLVCQVRCHCPSWSHNANFSIYGLWWLEYALLRFIEGKVSFILTWPFLLEIQPFVLFNLCTVFLHPSLVWIFKSLHFLSLLLFYFVSIRLLHSQMIWKLELSQLHVLYVRFVKLTN